MMTRNSIIHRSFAQKQMIKSKAQDQIWMIPATTCTTSSHNSQSKVPSNTSTYWLVGYVKSRLAWFYRRTQ